MLSYRYLYQCDSHTACELVGQTLVRVFGLPASRALQMFYDYKVATFNTSNYVYHEI